ncbi:MAG: Ig-like domain-containing protein [Pseudanabaenaceae cyanobacterium bins.68]|nr:Ig-like domain-containing protein [Pseudanabaenaceae cyanobacterium bins.68]
MKDNLRRKSLPFGQPLDLAVLIISATVLSLIGLLLWQGDRTAPQVVAFSWEQKQVTAADLAFKLTFNRPMDQQSVERNLKIVPPLAGRKSWAGRTMAYTLNQPIPYGVNYRLQLENAYDRFADEVDNHRPITPFRSQFSSPEPAFLYIGAAGEQQNRLILVNQAKQQVLTPEDLAVIDFRVYPDRQKVLVGAAPYENDLVNLLEQQLYLLDLSQANPQLELVLDAKEYQNFKFDLAANGETIVVQRLSRAETGQYSLWALERDRLPRSLENKPGGDFMITPDSAAVAIAQGEGVAILPLVPQADPLDFLPKFGMVLGFSRDGSQAAMVKFNKDYTRSLFFVTNQGVQRELVKISGSVLQGIFAPQQPMIYALLTDADLQATVFREQPYLAAVEINSGKVTRLLDLAGQKQIQLSLAPDGRKMLVSSVPASQAPGQPKPLPQLFELTMPQQLGTTLEVASLERQGHHPQWLP